MISLTFATYNIRCDCEEDGINQFPYRKDMILRKIQKEQPDVIGFQEVQPHMILWLKESFPIYEMVGCGRGADYEDEHNIIAYKKDVFQLLSLETFWLSDTPHIPGSRFQAQSACPRICTTVTLKHKELDKPIRYYNTHLDHETAEARVLGMKLILERIQKDNESLLLPTILTGDFNGTPDCEEVQMIAERSGLNDCTTSIPHTFHSYGKADPFVKIDYIFASRDVGCSRVTIWDDVHNGVYLSDHYPIVAEFSF